MAVQEDENDLILRGCLELPNKLALLTLRLLTSVYVERMAKEESPRLPASPYLMEFIKCNQEGAETSGKHGGIRSSCRILQGGDVREPTEPPHPTPPQRPPAPCNSLALASGLPTNENKHRIL